MQILNSPLALLLILAVGLVVGSGLTVLGWRGRRVGAEPRCRRCAYDLTVLAASADLRCPECGAFATGRNVTLGRAKRRWVPLAAGTLLLTGALGVSLPELFWWAVAYNWYPWLPRFVILNQIQADNADAIRELVRRNTTGAVSTDALAEFIPLALKQHGSTPRRPSVLAWAELLAALELAGRLSDDEVRQFHDQIVHVELQHPAVVFRGDKLLVWIWNNARGAPGLAGTCIVRHTESTIDGRGGRSEAGTHGRHPLARQGKSGTGDEIDTTYLAPGKHVIEYRGVKAFTDPDFEQEFNIAATIEIRGDPPSEQPPEQVGLVWSPLLGEVFRRSLSLRVSVVADVPDALNNEVTLSIEQCDEFPLDAAFDLVACIDGCEVPLDTLLLHRDSPEFTWGCRLPREWFTSDRFVPIMRANRGAAREMTSVVEIWDGELILDPIRIAPTQPAP